MEKNAINKIDSEIDELYKKMKTLQRREKMMRIAVDVAVLFTASVCALWIYFNARSCCGL